MARRSQTNLEHTPPPHEPGDEPEPVQDPNDDPADEPEASPGVVIGTTVEPPQPARLPEAGAEATEEEVTRYMASSAPWVVRGADNSEISPPRVDPVDLSSNVELPSTEPKVDTGSTERTDLVVQTAAERLENPDFAAGYAYATKQARGEI